MNNNFILSCESTVDLPYSYITGRGISVLFYTYTMDGEEILDNMGRDQNAQAVFYEKIENGSLPSTSQINTYRYIEYFDKLLEKSDVIHIAFGSGMTPSVANAIEAANTLKSKYPNRRISVIDSLCSSVGYGLLTESAADYKDSGADFDEVEKWIVDHRLNIHHQFFSTDLTMFKRSGRVSGPAAMFGTILGICPLMHLNSEGRIIAYEKSRGKKTAIHKTAEAVKTNYRDMGAYTKKCYIGHSNCEELAQAAKAAIEEKVPALNGNIFIADIGTIVASHCGPGTVAVFFYGEERKN
ncbi:MAG: DegV family protein [Clostridia bacterium]|nr:DegV family protein [Clostridia bacterium]